MCVNRWTKLVTKVLKDFVQTYPEAKISLLTGWSSEIVKSIYDGEAHIGIVRGQSDWKGNKIHLFRDTLYLVDKEMTSIDEVLTRKSLLFNLKVIRTTIRKFNNGGKNIFD